MTEVKYRTIVADPPWPYPEGFAGGNGQRSRGYEGLRSVALPYSTMTINDIRGLAFLGLLAPDARLFLWTTNRWLSRAFYVLEGWGFDYKQTLVWHKLGVNLPAAVAPNSAEFVLVGSKGSPERLQPLPSAVFSIARKGGYLVKSHARNPEAFLDMVEQVSPGPYLELFARRQRLGWDTWGNEALEHVSLETE